ncbi:uncharacterized protein DNG_04778 [Cephalotrichum gorgonifer]|uniref:Uncharacterized protein n=1 Tax=Cephalotrichum gorgonifer TaxID=2041049 RepID=A0AAE8MX99_9PEZI|nr:uncharacterized protein DNG_04778 [Cephalotrichum gorgonifer]
MAPEASPGESRSMEKDKKEVDEAPKDGPATAGISDPDPTDNEEEDEDEEVYIREAISITPITPLSRTGTPIPFSRSSDGRQTPLSQGRVSPEDRAQTPHSMTTATPPPPLSTRSFGKISEDGRKTPSDWTPSTPKTPIQGVSHISSQDSIRRKPVPAPSQDNLRDRTTSESGRLSALRNPLEKTTYTILPEQLMEKAPSTPDSTPRTHISLPGRAKETGSKADYKKLARLWWAEAVWLSVCLLSVIIIFAVLSAYDNRPVSTLPLNLNALLAFFTTVATVSFLIPTVECVSQWKWNYFRADARSLSDFQLFDSATRSPIGAAALLVKLRHTHVAGVGAAVILLSLLVPAVSQVAVGHKEDVVSAGNLVASLSATRILEADSDIEGLGAAIREGVVGKVDLEFPILCPTGQCDFESFEGLGICARVNDITDRLTVTAGASKGSGGNSTSTDGKVRSTRSSSHNVTLPREANCQLTTNQPLNVLTCKTDGSKTLSFDGDAKGTAIYSMPIIYSDAKGSGNSTEVEFEALEVLFHLCQGTYSASVRDARAEFKTVSTSAVVASDSADREVGVNCDVPTPSGSKGAVDCSSSDDIPSNAFMKFDNAEDKEDAVEVSAHFGALEKIALAIGAGTSGLWMRESEDGEASVVGTADVESISKVIYDGAKEERKNRVTRMAENIATSLTNVISAKQATSDTGPAIVSIPGTALLPQTLIRINYAALVLLLLLFIASLAFLIVTAILTDRDAGAEVLKSSALATLFALEEECRGVAGGIESVESMGRKARVMHVRLRDEAIVLAGEGVEARTEDRKEEV